MNYDDQVREYLTSVGLTMRNLRLAQVGYGARCYEEDGEIFIDIDLPINSPGKLFQLVHEVKHIELGHLKEHYSKFGSIEFEFEANKAAVMSLYGSLDPKHMPDTVLDDILESMSAFIPREIVTLRNLPHVRKWRVQIYLEIRNRRWSNSIY